MHFTNGQCWYADDFQTKKTMLLHGLGSARILKHIVDSELENGQLIPIKIEIFTSHNQVPIVMIRLHHQVQNAPSNLYWKMMKRFFPHLLTQKNKA